MSRRIWMAIGSVLLAVIATEGRRQEKEKQQASPMCDFGWVKDSSFWSWYFACGSEAGGGGSGAGLSEQPPAWRREDDAVIR